LTPKPVDLPFEQPQVGLGRMSARRLRRGATRHHQGNCEPISIASLFKMGADRLAKPVAKGFLAARASWLAKG
jgi:hypothetical protein